MTAVENSEAAVKGSIIDPESGPEKSGLGAYQSLVEWFRPFSKIYVAFSGGVDSALVLKAAVDGAGAARVIAVTADSASLPRAEMAEIEQLTNKFGVQSLVLKTEELDNPGYRANSGDRCYFCKQTLYGSIERIVDSRADEVAVDGTNTGDLGDYRPGLRAAAEHKIRHPLVETGFDKEMVRSISRKLDLPTAEKPALACLSSRIPPGTTVTAEKLRQIEQAEAGLRALGFSQLRVRYHELPGVTAGSSAQKTTLLARLEFPAADLARAAEPAIRTAINTVVSAAGFDLVTLDLVGYKGAGSEALVKLKSVDLKRADR